MEQIHDQVAGLDVHRDSITACFRQLGPRGGVVHEKDRFTTTTAGLGVLARWLAARNVQLVAMEATGVYWKPVFYALEDQFELGCATRPMSRRCLVARPISQTPSGWRCCRPWHGSSELRATSADPRLRELTRYRKTQIDARVSEIQRLEKVLQDAGIKLTSVASKILTQSGRAMIEGLIAGEHNGAVLAELAKGKMRPKISELTEALTGHFGAHHAVAAERILSHLDFLTPRSPPSRPR